MDKKVSLHPASVPKHIQNMRLIVEEASTGKLHREEALMASHANTLSITVHRTSVKFVIRKKFRVDVEDIFAGSVPFVKACFQQLGISLPLENPYPESLRPWLYRAIWRVPSLSSVTDGVDIFIKPADRLKRFTGFVLREPFPPQLYGVSRKIPVWCSETVDFISEWRAYVVNGTILDVRFADHGGDKMVIPNEKEMKRAVDAYTLSGEAPDGYAIDFGVIGSGETALVEVNDGFSIGAYDGLPAEVLWKVTLARTRQLMETIGTDTPLPAVLRPRVGK